MNGVPDAADRRRFRDEFRTNFAVSASAGSGKTTAISERLASMALDPEASTWLRRTAVVTFTRHAAMQIAERARGVLLQRMAGRTDSGSTALDQLDRAFFGTIHSFCLRLAQRYGQTVGIHLNPVVMGERADEIWWEEFLQQDELRSMVLQGDRLESFLRHVPLEAVFPLAREIDLHAAQRLIAGAPATLPPAPSDVVFERILALPVKGNARKNLELSQATARRWRDEFRGGGGFLSLYKPSGAHRELGELAAEWMAPLKAWLAAAGAALAGELAVRYRAFRFDRGFQNHADQIESALRILETSAILDRIREDGWRIILDEAQDTDGQQFKVLVEITRPVGSPLGEWPGGGAYPRTGHFCMVGDGEQAIYGSRADLRNYTRHLDAFARGEGGELLCFQTSFRTPLRVAEFLNATLPTTFSADREHNRGLAPAPGAPEPTLQVEYQPLFAGPAAPNGAVSRISLQCGEPARSGVEEWMGRECRQLAGLLREGGPQSVGAETWSEICIVAPRNAWLVQARRELEAAGLPVALLARNLLNRDHPVYAWVSGLLAVVTNPENHFEWVGVLREVFAISDVLIAAELRNHGRVRWEEPEDCDPPVRTALEVLRKYILAVDDEGVDTEVFLRGLCAAAGLSARARKLDTTGGAEAELERLLARAGDREWRSAGPRGYFRRLLEEREEKQTGAGATTDAVNLVTIHSAKGLEWPVVMVIGLWREIRGFNENGFRLLAGAAGRPSVYFDNGSIPEEMRESRERERRRELVRLLYVALTRARRHLVLSWGEDFGRSGDKVPETSFGALLGCGAELAKLPEVSAVNWEAGSGSQSPAVPAPWKAEPVVGEKLPLAPLPGRLLPHRLAKATDRVRTALHETSGDRLDFTAAGDEAIAYGTWWHRTMEFLPWSGDAKAIEEYSNACLVEAASLGFGLRARDEWALFCRSSAFPALTVPTWERIAEAAIFTPFNADSWIDGVVDLVLLDRDASRLWVVDWKTNRWPRHESWEAFAERLRGEYSPQLGAYGRSLREFFPSAEIRLRLFSTAAGDWVEIDFG